MTSSQPKSYRLVCNVLCRHHGAYFFEEGGDTLTVTFDRYCDMLENFLCPKMEEYEKEHDPNDFWFQQHGITAHTFSSHFARDVSRSPDLLTSRCSMARSLRRSEPLRIFPGISRLRFISIVLEPYKISRRAIEEEIAGIPQDKLKKVMENFQERLQMCIIRQGHHLDDTIFKT